MMFDLRLRDVILWHYEEAKTLIGIVDVLQNGYDVLHKDFWQKWYDDVFNIDTANDFGLHVWGKILNVKLSVGFEPQTKAAFGFGRERRNFAAPSNFGSRMGRDVTLTTNQMRTVIKARYFALTQRPTQDNINEFLKQNFWTEDGRAFVIDMQDMSTMLYTFNFNVDGELRFLLDNIDLLPRPAGVGNKIKIVKKRAFGFSRNRNNFSKPSNFGDLRQ